MSLAFLSEPSRKEKSPGSRFSNKQLWKPALRDVTKSTHSSVQPLPVSADTLHLMAAFFSRSFQECGRNTRKLQLCHKAKSKYFCRAANRRLKMQSFYNSCFCELVELGCHLGVCEDIQRWNSLQVLKVDYFPPLFSATGLSYVCFIGTNEMTRVFREQQPVVFLIYILLFFISQFIFKETLRCIVKKINGGTEGGRQGQDDTENIEVFIIWMSASSRILREFPKVLLRQLFLQPHQRHVWFLHFIVKSQI